MCALELDDAPAQQAWSRDGAYLAVGLTSGRLAIIDTGNPGSPRQLSAHAHGLFGLAWHPELPILATVGQDGMGRLWGVDRDRTVQLAELLAGNQWVEHVAWRPDGRQLALSAGRSVTMFRSDGEAMGTFSFSLSTVAALAWRPTGAQLAVAGYGGIEIYSVLDPASKSQRLSWRGSLLSLAWSPDSRIIAAGCQDKSVHFWRLREGRNSEMTGYEAKPRCLDWSTNSRWLATSGSSDLTLWSFTSGGPEGRAPVLLRGHRRNISALRFASKGRLLVSGCSDGQVCFWNTFEDFAPPAAVIDLESGISGLAWHPNVTRPVVACVTERGSVTVVAVEH